MSKTRYNRGNMNEQIETVIANSRLAFIQRKYQDALRTIWLMLRSAAWGVICYRKGIDPNITLTEKIKYIPIISMLTECEKTQRMTGSKPPKEYTWHYMENGESMILVRRDVHDCTTGGFAHTGGASVVKN